MAIIRFENEADLIKRLKSKDEDSFQLVFNKLKDKFYSVAYGILGNREDAEDALEFAFLEAYRNIKSFRGNSSLFSWLYKILVNACYQKARVKKAVSPGKTDFDENIEVSSSHKQTSPAFSELDRDSLRKVISKLPKQYHEVLVLRAFDNLSYEEIAETLDVRKGTVMSRLHRARSLLQKLVKR